jgi:hypothetical protein
VIECGVVMTLPVDIAGSGILVDSIELEGATMTAMTQNDWTEAADRWLELHIGEGRDHHALFDSDKLVVKIHGTTPSKPGVLARTAEVDADLATITDRVRDGYQAGVEGMLYALYTLESGRPVPIYVGIARATGKRGGLSSLFKSTRKKPRFDDYDGYHIGDLSTQVVPGYAKPKAYKRVWAEQMFTNAPDPAPMLRTEVYFWGRAWEAGDSSVLPTLGHTPLHLEEALLIHTFRQRFPGKLMNQS